MGTKEYLNGGHFGIRCIASKFPHSPILHYACRSLLTENNGKNNAIAMGTMRCSCCFLVAKQRTTNIEPHA